VFVSSAAGGVAFHPLPNAAWPGAGTLDAVLSLPVGPAVPIASSGESNNSGSDLDNSSAEGRLSEQLLAPLRRVLRDAHGLDADALLPPGTPLTPILAIGSNASPEQLVRTGWMMDDRPPDLMDRQHFRNVTGTPNTHTPEGPQVPPQPLPRRRRRPRRPVRPGRL
jgi:hypothetical protein